MKHEFALYIPELGSVLKSGLTNAFTLHNAEVATRIGSVLRLQPGESCILFDRTLHARCTLVAVQKKGVEFKLLEKNKNSVVQPKISCLLPLLKRDDLEAALYASVELGATDVQLVITEKVQRAWGGTKEFERLRRIMIAAAEQSKNFALPELYEPQPLPKVVAALAADSTKLFFDLGGQPAFTVMHNLVQQKPAALAMLVGPEGDLTVQEKALLAEHQFVVSELTPTVLRAVSAYTLGLGMLRSCLKDI